jgi:hypothetical protein
MISCRCSSPKSLVPAKGAVPGRSQKIEEGCMSETSASRQGVVPLLIEGLGIDDVVAKLKIDRDEVRRISKCWYAMKKFAVPAARTGGSI